MSQRITRPYEVFLRPKWQRVTGDFIAVIWAVSSNAAAYQWRKYRTAPAGYVFVFREQRGLL